MRDGAIFQSGQPLSQILLESPSPTPGRNTGKLQGKTAENPTRCLTNARLLNNFNGLWNITAISHAGKS
jgi:hypothetical protein